MLCVRGCHRTNPSLRPDVAGLTLYSLATGIVRDREFKSLLPRRRCMLGTKVVYCMRYPMTAWSPVRLSDASAAFDDCWWNLSRRVGRHFLVRSAVVCVPGSVSMAVSSTECSVPNAVHLRISLRSGAGTLTQNCFVLRNSRFKVELGRSQECL